MAKFQMTNGIALHEDYYNLLFSDLRKKKRAFTSVLGYMGIDYISFIIQNNDKSVYYLSSMPALDYTIIKNSLWVDDFESYPQNNNVNKIKEWSDIYLNEPHCTIGKLRSYKRRFSNGALFILNTTNKKIFVNVASKDGLEKNKVGWDSTIRKITKYCLKDLAINICPALYHELNQITEQKKFKLIINNKA